MDRTHFKYFRFIAHKTIKSAANTVPEATMEREMIFKPNTRNGVKRIRILNTVCT
ncbi:MAG: hypothetical protein JXB19_04085 [Bacteroidales bacterium]|nr:hypothetical protein [Bacteroidales bacterium]